MSHVARKQSGLSLLDSECVCVAGVEGWEEGRRVCAGGGEIKEPGRIWIRLAGS